MKCHFASLFASLALFFACKSEPVAGTSPTPQPTADQNGSGTLPSGQNSPDGKGGTETAPDVQQEIEAMCPQKLNATVVLYSGDEFGAGVVVNAQKGIILTALHVVKASQNSPGVPLFVRQMNGDDLSWKGDVVKALPEFDLALVRMAKVSTSKTELKYRDVGALDLPPPGIAKAFLSPRQALVAQEKLCFIGNPGNVKGTIKTGVFLENKNDDSHVQTDLQKGMSGGPAFDTWGKIVGINKSSQLNGKDAYIANLQTLRSICAGFLD